MWINILNWNSLFPFQLNFMFEVKKKRNTKIHLTWLKTKKNQLNEWKLNDRDSHVLCHIFQSVGWLAYACNFTCKIHYVKFHSTKNTFLFLCFSKLPFRQRIRIFCSFLFAFCMRILRIIFRMNWTFECIMWWKWMVE